MYAYAATVAGHSLVYMDTFWCVVGPCSRATFVFWNLLVLMLVLCMKHAS
jgi:hypothetical protein